MKRWRAVIFCLAATVVMPLADAAPSAAFEVRRAINIAQWFTWPRYESFSSSGIAWPPYRNVPRPPDLSELVALREAGFDAVRLPVDPSPFIVFTGTRREAVYGMLSDALERLHKAGLNVIVDLHPNSRHRVWGQHAVVKGEDAPAFMALADVAEEMAAWLASFDTDRVALELMNEPRLDCQGADQERWQRLLARLVARARAGNPRLALVVTGACVSSDKGLMALDPGSFRDGNLLYTFHFYDPFSFTHQGASFIPWPDRYLDEVPWPAGARPLREPMQRLEERMRALPELDAAERERALRGARHNLRKYYASNMDRREIDRRFRDVADWAETHGIPPGRIFLGEFGVVRKQGEKPGARCEDRVRWLADVREAAETNGFSWSYFNYDGPFALILDEQGRELDSAVLASLGLGTRTTPVAC